MSVKEKIEEVKNSIGEGVVLVAVSKTHPVEAIKEAYDAGQRIFGESRPQEMVAKHASLPGDVEWHFIGGLQTNKVKYIAPFVSLIHSADSERLIAVIDREAEKNGRVIDILLEVHIASEETKQGWDVEELQGFLSGGGAHKYPHIRIRGLMGMATYTSDRAVIEGEFSGLKRVFDSLRASCFASGDTFDTLSMGMSGDYAAAIRCGSNMVRVGSYIFGDR